MSAEDFQALTERECGALLQGKTLNSKLEDMTSVQIAEAWMMLDLVEDAIEKKKDEYRKFLMAAAEKEGVTAEINTRRVMIGESIIELQGRVSKEPDKDAMLSIVRQRGLDVAAVYDEVPTLVFNQSKVEFLVSTGKLSNPEVDALKKVTYALVVKKPKPITEAFASIRTLTKSESKKQPTQRRTSLR